MYTMRHLHSLLPLLLATFLLTACYYSHPNKQDHWTVTGEGAVDSVNFYIAHHYWTGYNFQATDSLALVAPPSLNDMAEYDHQLFDTVQLKKSDKLVVAQVIYVPSDSTDSVWVKVARDQLTQGWIHESELLARVVPDDPISKFIYYFSGTRSVMVICVLALASLFGLIQYFRHKHYRLVHFHDIPSFYPTLLCLCVSGSAALYGSMQRFVPDTWVEFYYHPTLNPFEPQLPLILALFIASVWTILIVAVALGAVCVVLYLVFTLTTPFYIGYALLVAYWVWAIRRYYRHKPSHLLCGMCRRSIPQKGRCPHCGAWNE